LVSGWGAAGTAGGTKVSRAVRFDWRGFADGNCDEKFDFVGGLGYCESAGRQADVRGDAGLGGGAVAADFDDDDRDNSWELALGKQTRSPMAMVVIGGLMTSTLLTLVVIPVVFTYMDGWPIWIFNLMRGTGKKGRAMDSIVDNSAIEINCSKYSRRNPPAVDPVSTAEGSKAH